jgi:hypothetical protein
MSSALLPATCHRGVLSVALLLSACLSQVSSRLMLLGVVHGPACHLHACQIGRMSDRQNAPEVLS